MKLVNVSENITLPEGIEKFSKELLNYYPNYNKWFYDKMIPGIIDQTREIICLIDKEIIWFISLKKEKKRFAQFLWIKNIEDKDMEQFLWIKV